MKLLLVVMRLLLLGAIAVEVALLAGWSLERAQGPADRATETRLRAGYAKRV